MRGNSKQDWVTYGSQMEEGVDCDQLRNQLHLPVARDDSIRTDLCVTPSENTLKFAFRAISAFQTRIKPDLTKQQHTTLLRCYLQWLRRHFPNDLFHRQTPSNSVSKCRRHGSQGRVDAEQKWHSICALFSNKLAGCTARQANKGMLLQQEVWRVSWCIVSLHGRTTCCC